MYRQQTLLALPSKAASVRFLLTSFPASTWSQATITSCWGVCNHLPSPWFCPCSLQSVLKTVTGEMLKSELDFATPPMVLQLTQHKSCNFLRSHKDLHDLGPCNLCVTPPPQFPFSITQVLEPAVLFPTSRTFHWECWGSGTEADGIAKLHFVLFEIWRHEFKVMPNEKENNKVRSIGTVFSLQHPARNKWMEKGEAWAWPDQGFVSEE